MAEPQVEASKHKKSKKDLPTESFNNEAEQLKRDKKLKKKELARQQQQQISEEEAKKQRKAEKQRRKAEQKIPEQATIPDAEAQRKEEKKRRKQAKAQQAAAAIQEAEEAKRKEDKKLKKKGNPAGEAEIAVSVQVEEKKQNQGFANGNSESKSNTSKSTGFYREHPDIAAMSEDQVEEYRKELNITVSEPQIRPIKLFSQAGLPASVSKCVAKFEKPTSIQAQCWPALLLGRDVVGIAKTGSGKTLGFMLPAYVKILDLMKNGKKGPFCLVLAPTRELALQSAKVCEDMEAETQVKTVCIYGGADAHQQVAGIRRGAHVVIATPGRLIALMNEGKLSLANVIYAVLDEADRMLDMGFEPDVRTIMAQVSTARQTLLFSATWPTAVQKLGAEFVKDPFHVLVGNEQLTANHDVAQIVEVTDEAAAVKDKRLLAIMKQYYNKQLKNRMMVFVLYKKDVPRVEQLLLRAGYDCGSISSDNSQDARIRALDGFRNGSKPILVGTDVASRGLDIPDVSHVINYSFPLTIADYIHRIGRTGRCGKKGVSHTFFTKFDKGLAGELVNVLNEAQAEVPADLLKFGTGVKRKEHGMYGQQYKTCDGPMPVSKRVVFS